MNSSHPLPVPRSSVMSGLSVQDDAARRTHDSGCGPLQTLTGNRAMVDSYMSSFNSPAVTSAALHDYEDDEVFEDNVPSSHPFTLHNKGRAPPIPSSAPLAVPHSALANNKPPLQRLEDLPGLSIVTWEEFVESPSVLCGLFELDRNDFIQYNTEQVNVFFHDSRMDQPTLGSPSGDGMSWTIFIDNYNHLRNVRNWLTERVSVILLQLLRPRGEGTAACLVAINPVNKSVGQELNSSFSSAIESFLHQRNFSVELNLNKCVKTWCHTVLKMPCVVRGGRLVVTNADECVPCCQTDNVAFCVLCFPVWGIQKLIYRFKRRSEYDDFFLYFKAEDLALCTKSPKLKQYTENNGKDEVVVRTSRETKGRPWLRKNRQSVTAATQTVESGEDGSHLAIEEVEEEDDLYNERGLPGSRPTSKGTAGQGKDSGFSSTSTSTDRFEPQLSNGFPSYRPTNSAPARFKEMERNQVIPDRKTNQPLPSISASASLPSCTLSADPSPQSSIDPSYRDGAHGVPGTSLPYRELHALDDDDESLNIPTPRTPRTPREDARGAGFDPTSTVPAVGSDDEHGNYRLLADSPSPRPDTPFHKSLPHQSLKAMRAPRLSQDVIVDENMEIGDGDIVEDRIQLKGTTASLPFEPGAKQRKKRISKVLRDISGPTGSQTFSTDPSQASPLRANEGGLYARENQAFVPDEPADASFKQLKTIDKVKYTPIKGLKDKKTNGQKAFPYTSDLLDFVGENKKSKTSYNIMDQMLKEEVSKPKKKKSAVQKKAEDMLFAPRIRFGDDNKDRNCLSDNDIGDEDYGDMEPDSVMSDVEGVASPRLIPVKKTNRTVSVNSVLTPRSDVDTDWEITDCELDDDSKTPEGPKILAGAKAAQQLRSNSAHRSRESPANSGDPRRRGGIQNDSRRRYIALNSLRRKANQLALQAELRKQKRPDSSSSIRMELMDV